MYWPAMAVTSSRVRVGEEVRVGGDAVVSLDGSLAVPEADEDEILEV